MTVLREDIVAGNTGHIADHESLHDGLNALRQAIVQATLEQSPPTKFIHVVKDHGAVQAAIATLANANGTGDNTIADVGASFNQVTLNNNFRDLSDKVNAILVALRATGIILP